MSPSQSESGSKKPKPQDVVAIVRSLTEQRARQRLIPLRNREITIKRIKEDIRIKRWEIFIDYSYSTRGNPVLMIDRVLDAVVEFDRRDYEERVRRITEVKTFVLQWSSYLERTLSRGEYRRFIEGLLLNNPGPVIPVASLAPSEPKPDGLTNIDMLLLAEAEYLSDIGIHLRV